MFVEPVVSEALAEPLLPRQPGVMGAVVTVENVDSLHVAHVDQPKPGKVLPWRPRRRKAPRAAPGFNRRRPRARRAHSS